MPFCIITALYNITIHLSLMGNYLLSNNYNIFINERFSYVYTQKIIIYRKSNFNIDMEFIF